MSITKKFQSEDFHIAKIFVLVCRTGSAFDFCFQTATGATGNGRIPQYN
jgi:hypothetical protein